jgi:hypothetical protein
MWVSMYQITTDQMFCIRQLLKEKSAKTETVHQLFVILNSAYDLVWSEVLYNILIVLGTHQISSAG